MLICLSTCQMTAGNDYLQYLFSSMFSQGLSLNILFVSIFLSLDILTFLKQL